MTLHYGEIKWLVGRHSGVAEAEWKPCVSNFGHPDRATPVPPMGRTLRLLVLLEHPSTVLPPVLQTRCSLCLNISPPWWLFPHRRQVFARILGLIWPHCLKFQNLSPTPSQTQYSPSLSPGFLTSRSDILYIVTYLFCSLFSQVELNRNRGWVCFIHCVPPPPRPEQCLPHGRYSVNIKRMDKWVI